MKLLFVTSLKENGNTVTQIFEKAGIKVFSVTNTIGHKEEKDIQLMDSWFACGTDQFDSIFVFSFTEDENAYKALGLIKEWNLSQLTSFPIRGFIMAVEQAGY